MFNVVTEQGQCWVCANDLARVAVEFIRSRTFATRSGTVTRFFCGEACAHASDTAWGTMTPSANPPSRSAMLLSVASTLVQKYGYGQKAGRRDYVVVIPADEFDALTKAVERSREAPDA